MLSCVQLFATPWTVAHQAPLSMRFSRQEYWSRLPCPPPGGLPNPGIKPMFQTHVSYVSCIHTTKPEKLLYTDQFRSVQFILVAQSCPTLCEPMNYSTPGLPVHHQLPEFTQTHVHRVGNAIQPSHPLSFLNQGSSPGPLQ